MSKKDFIEGECYIGNKKLSKEAKEFLNKNPEGKIADLPEELKDIFSNIFKEVQEIAEEKKNQNKDE